MTRATAAHWAGGLAASALGNAALLALVAAAIAPAPARDPQPPETRLDIAAYRVPRADADARPPPTETGREAAGAAPRIGGTAIPRAEAVDLPPASQAVRPAASGATSAPESPRGAQRLAPAKTAARAATPSPIAGATAEPTVPDSRVADALAMPAAPTVSQAAVPAAAAAPAALPPDARIDPTATPADRVPALTPPQGSPRETPPSGAAAPAAPLRADMAQPAAPDVEGDPARAAPVAPDTAREATPRGTATAAVDAAGAEVSADSAKPRAQQATAGALRPTTAPPATDMRSERAAAVQGQGLTLPQRVPTSRELQAGGAEGPRLAPAGLQPAAAPQGQAQTVAAGEAAPGAAVAVQAAADASSAAQATPETTGTDPARPTFDAASASPPATTEADQRPPPAEAAAGTDTARLATVPDAQVPRGETTSAVLAWSGGDRETVDPVSVAAVSAFMRPGVARSGERPVRDGISDALEAVGCARLQVIFQPEAGRLALRGHVPDPAAAGPVRDALRAQLGGSIPIDDGLLVLPRPQCDMLDAVAQVGLPQSAEQFTDPRIIGQEAHVREYRYAEGQRLVLDLEAPDYPAYVYVDYFDADGQVIHLQPNGIVPLQRLVPKAQVSVGGPRPDGPSLDIRIAPPFGQEIAVAFASSRPLFDAPRPLVEPALPYLNDLRTRIAEARADDPGFRGEWVYFFVTTGPE